MGSTIGQLKVRLDAEIKAFQEKFASATKQMQKFQRSAQSIGRSLTTSLTLPIVGTGVAALAQAKRLDELTKALEAVTGGTEQAGQELDKLRKIAQAPGIDLESAVQGFLALKAATDDVGLVEKAVAQFGNAVALSAGSTEDLTAVLYSMRELMTDLNQQSLKEINRRIPQFSKLMREAFGTDQAQAIKKMGISGKEFADTMVKKLGELQRVTGGFSNSWQNARIAVNEALAKIGTSIATNFKLADKLDAFADTINNLADRFNNLNPFTQKAIGYTLGLTAAIGPAIFVTGKLAEAALNLNKAFKLLGTGLKGKVGLAGLFIAVAEAITYATDKFTAWSAKVGDMGGALGTFQKIFLSAYGDWNRIGDFVAKSVGAITIETGKLSRGGGLADWFKNNKKAGEELIPTLKDITKEVEKFNLASDQKEAADSVWAVVAEDLARARAELARIQLEISQMARNFNKKPERNTETAPTTGLPSSDMAAGRGEEPAYDKRLQSMFKLKEAADAAGVSFDYLWNKNRDLAVSLADLPIGEVSDKLEDLKRQTIDTAEVLAAGFQDMVINVATSLGQLAAGVGSGMDVFKALLTSIADILINLGKLAVATGIAAEGIKDALKLHPVAAILGGAALIALGNIVKARLTKLTPALAEGGLAFGKTLAVVGDNFGAPSDPEVISPLSKLKHMLGGMGGGVLELRMGSVDWDGRKFILGWEQAYWQKFRSAPTLVPIKRT